MTETLRSTANTRRNWWPLVGAVAAVVLVFAVFARIRTDWLWYTSIGFRTVFTTRLATSVVLFAIFAVVMAALVAANLLLAQRLRPRVRSSEPSQLLDRFGDIMDLRRVSSVVIPAVILGLMAGVSAASQVDIFLAWRRGTSFGLNDPYFNRDVSFYVFDYPWYRYVLGFLMTAFVVATLVAAVAHFAMGALRSYRVVPSENGQPRLIRQGAPLGSAAQVHVSVLMAIVLVIYGLSNLLDRYGFSMTDNSLFTGINYTDDNSRVIAKLVMAAISFICAGLFVANVWLRRWRIPLISLVLMLVSSIIIGGIYPAIVQRFNVKPDEPLKERPYIEENIKATRAAFGIEDVKIQDYSAKTSTSAGQLRADAEALPGIRLVDPEIVPPTFEQLQQVRGYYAFPKVLDVDRYTIDGQFTDAVVAARELELDALPDNSWNNLHTVFTHGYGLVAAYGNRWDGDSPAWISGDIPTVGALPEHEPRIYFGELSENFAVVGAPAGTDPVELDTPGGGDQGAEKRNTYDGKGGVAIGNWFTRALYALRFADINLLLSNRVNSESKILYDRQPIERVRRVAPWLTVDSDAYPAVVDGRILWIVDGYTTSGNFPNSTQLDLRTATSDSVADQRMIQLSQPVNYIRNSVKAVVDAADGTVTLYQWDEEDPIVRTWMDVYPGTVQPKSKVSAQLLQHLRYPQDLFKVQRQILGRYHVTDANSWYQRSDLWEVPNDPVKGTEKKEPPYYLSIKWPGDDKPIFSQTAVFVPKGRENLGAYLSVNADASSPNYGQLRVLKLSDSQQIPGPGQTYNAINTNETVAERLRPFKNQGSAAAQDGNLLTIPVGGGLLYVQPIYTQQQVTSGGYPALRFVVVRFGDQVAIGDTLQEALDEVFKGDSGAVTGEQVDTGSGTDQPAPEAPKGAAAVSQQLANAEAAFVRADKALTDGDLGTYGSEIEKARRFVEAAQKASES